MMLDLEAIEERYRRALDAKPGKGPITDINALTDSVCDVPELLKELRRLADSEILGGFSLGDRVQCVVREHSIPHVRSGRIHALNSIAVYPITILLDEPTDNGPYWSCAASELTRVAD